VFSAVSAAAQTLEIEWHAAFVEHSRFWTIPKSGLAFARNNMQKSLFNKDYRLFLSLLKRAREHAGLTQGQLARRLAKTQTFVSKCERGERRLDIVEVRAWCKALDIRFPAFVSKFHTAIERGEK